MRTTTWSLSGIHCLIHRFLVLFIQALLLSAAVLPHTMASEPALKKDESIWFLPVELESDNGAANGDATLLRIQPLYAFPARSDWKLVHLDIITLADAPGGIPGSAANPEPVEGERQFGLSDLIHTSFYTPESSGDFIWGMGGILSIPTASDKALGSEKWAAGPAFRMTYRQGPWNLGFIAGQRWSFAGDSQRQDINSLMIRGAFRRSLNDDWFLVSAPIITANWNADSSDRWLVPVGGGIGRKFTLNDRDGWALSFQVYGNAVRPDGAPRWSFRMALVTVLPSLF